jgi:hypothetical protein
VPGYFVHIIRHLTGTNAGNINNGPTFSAFPNLVGSSDTDRFVFDNGAGVSGSIAGGGGDKFCFVSSSRVLSGCRVVFRSEGGPTDTSTKCSRDAEPGGDFPWRYRNRPLF